MPWPRNWRRKSPAPDRASHGSGSFGSQLPGTNQLLNEEAATGPTCMTASGIGRGTPRTITSQAWLRSGDRVGRSTHDWPDWRSVNIRRTRSCSEFKLLPCGKRVFI